MAILSYGVANGVARIFMDSPPVNALGLELRKELVVALDAAFADPSVETVVLAGNDAGFSSGADIAEFDSPTAFAEPSVPTIIELIESSKKPVIAAISGVCMGGGLELALGCHYRVGMSGAKIALPEVNLGILPGAGGTQRLPRLIGVEPALNMIVSGKTFNSQDLATSGLFDEFVQDNLIEGALRFASTLTAEAGKPRITSKIPIAYPNAEAFFQFARTNVGAANRHLPAPRKCVDAVAASVTMNFRDGLAFEKAAFEGLMRTAESQALRHAFFAERAAAKIPDVPGSTPVRPIKKVAIIGAGTMGVGIAMSFLNAGMDVVMLEMNQAALDRGIEQVRNSYQSLVKRGRMGAEDMACRMNLLTTSLTYEEIASSDLVVEAVFEDLAIKEDVFRKLGAFLKQGAILATNTSTLDVNKIANASGRPKDVLGMHFFSPANVMKLLEVVRGKDTAIDVMATAMSVGKRIKKTAVVSGVCDGFIGNRMLNEYIREAFGMIEEGASPGQVDGAIEKWGMAMGPFRMLDLAGNDVHWAVRKRQAAEDPSLRYSEIADELCEMGRFGQKTGKGWYLYKPGERVASPDPEVDAVIQRYRERNGLVPRKVTSEEIVERLVLALVNEGARILEEGIAQRASDIDVVYLAGYGFPVFRGGPMFYADQVGLYKVMRAIEKYGNSEQRRGVRWQPAAILKQLAAEGRTFN